MIFLAHYLPHSAENDEIIAALEKIVDFKIVLKPFKIAGKKGKNLLFHTWKYNPKATSFETFKIIGWYLLFTATYEFHQNSWEIGQFYKIFNLAWGQRHIFNHYCDQWIWLIQSLGKIFIENWDSPFLNCPHFTNNFCYTSHSKNWISTSKASFSPLCIGRESV